MFNILHDGIIGSANIKEKNCELIVDIPYLTNRIHPGFEHFKVTLCNFQNLSFLAWPSELGKEKIRLNDFNGIFSEEPQILSANVAGDKFEVTCNIHNAENKYCGGEMIFTCTSAIVVDQQEKTWSIEELDELCKGYWDEWANKNKKV
ncbi:hypothetical protein [Cerasicoccus arenae]|uniref:Uncharacterized protein n=1 Tax=Cerasicoccus arenae TaxID=424488 RepID=A0A8J3DDL3_9BACT|nr:hypothetical protein [Cerasicoccus arenae]MBK1860108.1 hypothetical protein [Cerasicoccus arenae]GHB93798.1 hypothetical protein GCM10007047_06670 [Cerasicoccus arenae]